MKKLISVLVVFILVFGMVGFTPNTPAEVKSEKAFYSGGPFDLAIANDEKLAEMLKASGKIAPNATAAEVEKGVRDFLKAKAASAAKAGLNSKNSGMDSQLEGIIKTNPLTHGNGNKLGLSKKGNLQSAQAEIWNGEVTSDKVLAILIDFPDYQHNSITPEETDMYYKDYTKAHFEQMLFGANGYTGPNGESFISMKQYYEQQSGGSYTVNGAVAGWYTAKHPAAYYGGNYPDENGSDARPRSLVYEALLAVSKDPSINLLDFDKEDRYDLDGDGDYREPDGLIDHIMIFHAGVGEEAGGGALGSAAIWSHRWNLGGVATLPGTSAEVDYWDGMMGAYDYTIQPEDAATGVCAHEYGHDLGLPDEYDTAYSGSGEPVAYWSIMSSGSWTGKIGGTEPVGFSPWAKEYFQNKMGGNWLTGTTVEYGDITKNGLQLVLDQATTKGANNDVVRINLPMKEKLVTAPTSGQFMYHGGKGNELDNSMYTLVDLSAAANAKLNFKTWYAIEEDWDYAGIFVSVDGKKWDSIPGNITTTYDPEHQNPGNGITGFSNGWLNAEFDLSAYAGQNIILVFNYWTDAYVSEAGFYVDDIAVTVDGNVVLTDNADENNVFDLEGFEKSTGKTLTNHYYLIEWRNHHGVDKGLANIKRGNSFMSYDPGMVIWYVDDSFDNNWTGIHPGDGYLGVVDADQSVLDWSDKSLASAKYQVHDAAFGLSKTEKMFLDYSYLGFTMKDNQTARNPLFDDSASYFSNKAPEAGRKIVSYGIKIRVVEESKDRSSAKILIFK